MKPSKTIYHNQKEVHDHIVSKLKKNLKYFSRVYIIGSLAEGKFGKYDKEYEGYLGSDIDLVVIPSKMPRLFKYKGEFHNWHKAYFGGYLEISNIKHPINYMVPFKQDLKLFLMKAKELNWRVKRLK